MEKLHILNGDYSFQQLKKTAIQGDVLVWREILCEGPTLVDLTTEEFWKSRRQFLEDFFESFESTKHDDLKQLFFQVALKNYEEIILWFEFDLFCQVNLIAVLSWLYKTRKKEATTISLICVGKHPSYEKLIGLGELQANEFAALYPQRQPLNKQDLAFANTLWELYCSDKHDTIIPTIRKNNTTAFPYLEAAMYQHQKRFPNEKNGLTQIEFLLLKYIQSSPKSKQQIIGEMLRNQEVYGFGDLQYFIFLDSLSPLFEEKNDCLYLNTLGKAIIAGRSFYQPTRKNHYFGGCPSQAFFWEDQKEKLEIGKQ